MKKIYKIFILLIALIFLTTYNPNNFNLEKKKKNFLFKIKNIEVLNNYRINKIDVLQKLNHIYKENIILISVNEITRPLKSLDFFEKVEVKKRYPDTILIKIYETTPVGFFYKNGNKYIIDSSSNLINFEENILEVRSPNIFGDGAENEFINFYKQLQNNHFPMHRVKNYYYFQIDRWDLQLFNNQTIKFPHKKKKEAIKKSMELLNRDDFKDYEVIDLRLDGKIVVE